MAQDRIFIDITVNHIFVTTILFFVFVLIDIFPVIYSHRLQNWTMQENVLYPKSIIRLVSGKLSYQRHACQSSFSYKAYDVLYLFIANM